MLIVWLVVDRIIARGDEVGRLFKYPLVEPPEFLSVPKNKDCESIWPMKNEIIQG